MIARILLLRSVGVRLEVHLDAGSSWSCEGYLEMQAGRGRRLVLRTLGSAPDCGVMHKLLRPMLVNVNDGTPHVQGIGAVEADRGLAAVVQKW